MKITLKIIFVIALIGFILSLIAHVSTYFGVNPQRSFSFVWILHIGIFVVFAPAVSIMKKLDNGKQKFFSDTVRFAPAWMKGLCVIFFFYAIINFISFMSLMGDGNPDIISGNYVISNHGKIVREISQNEYEKYRSYEVRGFSGHWMVFYISSATVLFSQ